MTDEKPVPFCATVEYGSVKFKIGNQSFRLGYDPEDEEDITAEQRLEWMRSQLEKALVRLAGRPPTNDIHSEQGEDNEDG